jgi:MraZ protein
MFIGEYTISMDAKGRINIPAKFRSLLNSQAVITRGFEQCLFLYTRDEWEKIASKLGTLPLTKSNSRAVARFMLAGAFDVELDGQGRIVVPDYLRKFAKLTKKVIVVGLYSRIEIWDEESWQAYRMTTEKDSSTIAEGLEVL